MSSEDFFGYCADGHLHQIRSDYVLTAMQSGEDFESKMFFPADIEESSIEDESSFVPLAPTNCPNLEKMLFFDRPWRTNKLPERRLAPYHPNNDDARTPAIFLMDFEKHEDRFSETKERGKESLYELIKDALLPEVDLEQAQGMTYEILRQIFLRKFWSIEEQQKTYSDLRSSQYPMYQEQHVRDFVFYWIELFSCQTYYLTRTIYKQIMKKIPEIYQEPMKEFKNGGFFDNFYGALLEFENTQWPGMYTDYTEDTRRCYRNDIQFWPRMISCDGVFATVMALLGIGLGCYIYFFNS
ncbi:uncharacterized protein LOC135844073 [Planococcus citri]|uniref:uncharacterized protein LOC135844073 n=1 Tax=Planococcus citri TaxID=170843 RepID=UPI0031F7F317